MSVEGVGEEGGVTSSRYREQAGELRIGRGQEMKGDEGKEQREEQKEGI